MVSYIVLKTTLWVSTNATFLEKDYMKNYKVKREVIIEEIIRETILKENNVEALVIDKILSYRRINVDIPIPRIIL